MLLDCAKSSFHTLKQSWREGQNEEAAKKAEMNDRNTRMYRRRCRKYTQMEAQFEAYAEKYHILVSVVHEQLLSDEASGPEDGQGESAAVWKVRVAAKYGLTDLSPSALKNQHFLEVLKFPWRSDEVSFPILLEKFRADQ
ncbi:hypothetical protein B0H19DRAFT_1271979 [Mycena capillaripes]|nr:hypothetical protein B0H19DRAFT_1271979 [Mycena capillaripes]